MPASPANSRQWGRSISLRITTPEGLTEINGPAVPIAKQLRISFSVEKSIGDAPGKARISIANLAPRTRDRLSGITRRVVDFAQDFTNVEKRLTGLVGGSIELLHAATGSVYVQLLAGHRAPAQIFEGTLSRADTSRSGTEQILTLEPVDGQLGMAQAVFDTPFAKGASALTIIKRAVQICGWSEGTILAPGSVPTDLSTYKLSGPFHQPGPAIDTIKALLAGLSLDWWIDDGAFYVTAKGRPLPGPPVVLSDEPGPGALRILQPKRVEGDGLQVGLLLAPSVRIGGAVQVLSAQYGGTWRCERLLHTGENRGPGFTTTAILRDFL